MTTATECDTSLSAGQRRGSPAVPKVLCIDDDPDFMTAMDLRLSKYEVQVIKAFFGSQGIWLATSEQPDVIITDLNMPQGQGEYVIDFLRKDRRTAQIPIIVLTGKRTSNLQQILHSMGVEKVLTKPVRFDELASELSQYIDLRERTDD